LRFINTVLIRLQYLFLPTISIDTLVILIFFSTVSGALYGQLQKDINTIDDLFKYTELALGSDKDLINGKAYFAAHTRSKGHPYYPDKHWQNSILYINSKKFSNYQLKYNIEIDRIILNYTKSDGAQVPILLNTNYIDSIQLGNHTFLINAKLISNEKKFKSFFNRINTGKFILYETFETVFKADFTQSTPYGRYGSVNHKYLLCANEQLYPVSSKKSFLIFFKDIKPKIKKYLRVNRINFKKANATELKGLMDYCNDLSDIKE